MAKCIIWVRSSTTAQECESQREELIKTATSEPYKFKESDLIEIGKVGASAIKLNKVYRQEVNQLLNAIDNEPDLSTIFVWEVSRLARNEQAFYAMKNKIIEKKIQLICNVPQIKLLDDNGEVNQGMEITLNLLVTLAKQEMDIKKKRFARGKKQKAKEGKFSGGRIPFGYKAFPDRDNFIDVDEREAEIVKEVFNLYEEGYSLANIAIELHERGYRNPRYKSPQIIQLGLVAHIIKNKCYTGVELEEKVHRVKDKIDGEETEWTRYARKFPQIISLEQFNKCRDIAKENRTTIGKGRNIYYAKKLVKCPSCGCFWSANNCKATYHCYNASKTHKTWLVDGRKTAHCKNRTTLNINVLDSILWYFAKRIEADFFQQASGERREALLKQISMHKKKIDNIPSQIEVIEESINKLALRNAEGYLTDKTFEEKVAIKNKEKNELIDKKITYQKNIEEFEKAIKKIDFALTGYYGNVKHINEDAKYVDEKLAVIAQYNDIYKSICNITDDKERYEIIHRVIDCVEIENVKIKYKFKIGWKEAKAKKIIIHKKDWNLDTTQEERLQKKYSVYYIPNHGKFNGIILDGIPTRKIPEEIFLDDKGNEIGKAVWREYINDYKKVSDAQFDYMQKPHPVSAIEIPYLNRFTDKGKNKRREREKEEAFRPVNGYLRIEDVMSLGNLKSGQVYGAIYNGTLKATFIRKKYFIAPNDAELFLGKLREKKEIIGGKLPAYEIAKRMNLNYQYVLRRVKKGKLPSEYFNGEYLVYLEDAEKYFSTKHNENKGRDMGGFLSAASIAKMYGCSYKSVRKMIASGKIPSTKRNGYYYVSPQDAENYFKNKEISNEEFEG